MSWKGLGLSQLLGSEEIQNSDFTIRNETDIFAPCNWKLYIFACAPEADVNFFEGCVTTEQLLLNIP